MSRVINSWSKLNEAVATGKDKYLNAAGKKVKLTYKIQSNTKFVLKLINFEDIIINDKLTQEGINAITSFLNEEDPFTINIGQLTPNFFKDNFIVYKILKDGEILGRTKQKIQFNIEKRKDPSGNVLHPNISADTQFIEASEFEKLSPSGPTVISGMVTAAQQTQFPDPTPDQEASSTSTEAASEKGKKFLYTMRANSKIYLMTFGENGELIANTKDGSDPNGTVSYDTTNKKVMWSTKLDDSATNQRSTVSQSSGLVLFTDSEITNNQDKLFLQKIFTDSAFRKKIIEEYEAEYAAGEITAENIKNLLFYKDGTAIFSKVTKPEGEESTTGEVDVDAFIKSLQQYKK